MIGVAYDRRRRSKDLKQATKERTRKESESKSEETKKTRHAP